MSGESRYQMAQRGFAEMMRAEPAPAEPLDALAAEWPHIMVGRVPSGGWFAIASRYPDWDDGPGSICDVGESASEAVAALLSQGGA